MMSEVEKGGCRTNYLLLSPFFLPPPCVARGKFPVSAKENGRASHRPWQLFSMEANYTTIRERNQESYSRAS